MGIPVTFGGKKLLGMLTLIGLAECVACMRGLGGNFGDRNATTEPIFRSATSHLPQVFGIPIPLYHDR